MCTLRRMRARKDVLLCRYRLRLQAKLDLAMEPTGPVRGRIREPVARTALDAVL